MADPILPVAYLFETTADAGDWRLLSFDLVEAINEPYLCRTRICQAESEGTDPAAFLGASCEITLNRGDAVERRQCGLVKGAYFRGAANDQVIVELEIVPALDLLGQRVNSRIFQEMDAKEILAAVLEEALGPYERTVKLDDIGRRLAKREYTVQHRESDLDFVHRLMEEEGISYYFDHSGDNEELVLFDENNALPDLETVDGGEVPVDPGGGGTAPTESLTSLAWTTRLRPTSVVLKDFDFTQPAVDLTKEARATDSQDYDRELYESGVTTTIGDYQPTAYGAEDGQDQARLRQEAQKARQKAGRGASDVINMRAGVAFETVGHPLAALDDKFLVTRVRHFGEASYGPLLSESDGEVRAYSNQIECAPFEQVWRPPRRAPEPRVLGPMTAVVVGPAGEEIHTDDHGRIKVQFHWDRAGQRDEFSSCWMRVAQTWAGAGFGTVFLPRIGMEVVVHFIDGNPDRPLVIGCVYNGENPPPYALPDEKTKSTIFTQSSIGGGGHNELTFEDAKGAEQIYMHAQKDWDTDVNNDNNLNVGSNEDLDVTANRTKHVKANQTTTVDGNHDATISGTRDLTLSGNLDETTSGNRNLTLSGNDDATVSGNRTTAISGDDTLSVSGNRTTSVSGDYTQSIGGTLNTNVGGGHTLNVEVTGDKVWHGLGPALYVISGGDANIANGPVKLDYQGVKTSVTGAATETTAFAIKAEVTGGIDHERSLALQSSKSLAKCSMVSTTKSEVKSGGSLLEYVPSAVTFTGGGVTIKLKSGKAKIKAPTNVLVYGDVEIKKKTKAKKALRTPGSDIYATNLLGQ